MKGAQNSVWHLVSTQYLLTILINFIEAFKLWRQFRKRLFFFVSGDGDEWSGQGITELN